jgi:hypothetical protein
MRCSRWIAITQCSRTDRILVWNPQSGTEPHRAQVLRGTNFPGSAAPAVPEPSNLHLLVAGLAQFRSRPPSLSKANAMLASLLRWWPLLPCCLLRSFCGTYFDRLQFSV